MLLQFNLGEALISSQSVFLGSTLFTNKLGSLKVDDNLSMATLANRMY